MMWSNFRSRAGLGSLLFCSTVLSGACSGDDGGDPAGPEPPEDRDAAPASIRFTTQPPTLDRWGDTLTVVAVVRDAQGGTVPSASLAWTSSAPSIVAVDGSGRLTSGVVGTAEITASVGGISASLSATVSPQLNAACTVRTPVAPGGAAATAVFELHAENLPIPGPSWDGWSYRALDFDGDSDDDLLRFQYSFPSSAEYSGQLDVLENQGGTLVDASDAWLDAPIVPDHPRDYEVADFDGDGREELFVAQHGFDGGSFPGAPNLFLASAGGRVVNEGSTRLSPNDTDGFTHGSAAADIDCDGDLDLLTVNATAAAPSRLYLNSGGSFVDASDRLPASFRGPVFIEAAFVDFDLDGDPDLLMGPLAGGGRETTLLVNDGFGSFRATSRVRVPPAFFEPDHAVNGVKSGDVTGDGYPDLVLFEIPTAFSSTSAIRVWANDGDGGFSDVTTEVGLPAQCSGEVIEPLFVEDLNGDGWADFLVPLGCAEIGDGAPTIAMNAGGRFVLVPVTDFRPYFEYATAYPFDMDGDGDLDLFLDHGGGPAILRNRSVGG